MRDLEMVLKALRCLSNPFDEERDCDNCSYDFCSCVLDVTADALELLNAQEPMKPRLLAAEEVQHLLDKTVICVEQLFSREDEERGYITGRMWGIVCNRTNAPDGGLILSILGTFFPNTVREIPYKAIYRDENTKKRHTAVYQFWTDRPTDEQSKAVKWE